MSVILVTLGVLLGVSLSLLVLASTYYYKKPLERILRSVNRAPQEGAILLPADDEVEAWVNNLKKE